MSRKKVSKKTISPSFSSHDFWLQWVMPVSVCFVLFFVIFGYSEGNFLRPRDDFKELVLYGSLFVFILSGYFFIKKNKEIFEGNSQLIFLFFIFGLYGVLQSLFYFSIFPEIFVSVGRWLLLFVFAIFFSKSSVESISKTFVLAVIFSFFCVFFIKNIAVYIYLPIGHISYFSDFLVVLVPWSIFSFVRSRNFFFRIFFILTLLSQIVAISAFGRKATILALFSMFILLFFLIWMSQLKEKRFLQSTIAITFVVALFWINFHSQIINLISTESDQYPKTGFNALTNPNSESFSSRIDSYISRDSNQSLVVKDDRKNIYPNTLNGFLERPIIGWGYNQFRYNYAKFTNEKDNSHGLFSMERPTWLMHPHNEVLLQLFEGGLAGFILFCLPIFLILWGGVRFILEDNKPFHLNLAIISLTSMIGGMIAMQFNTTGMNPLNRFLIFLNIAMLLSLRKNWNLFPESFFKKFSTSKILIVLLIITGCMGCLSVSKDLASYYLSVSTKEYGSEEGEKKIDLAGKLLPNSFEYFEFKSGALRRKMDFDADEKLWEKARNLYPNIPGVYYHLGLSLAEQGKNVEALKILDEIIEKHSYFEDAKKLRKSIDIEKRQP